MRTSELPQDVVEDLKEADFSIETIEGMRPEEVLDAWLVWNGIIGFTGQILQLCHILVLRKHLDEAIEDAGP